MIRRSSRPNVFHSYDDEMIEGDEIKKIPEEGGEVGFRRSGTVPYMKGESLFNCPPLRRRSSARMSTSPSISVKKPRGAQRCFASFAHRFVQWWGDATDFDVEDNLLFEGNSSPTHACRLIGHMPPPPLPSPPPPTNLLSRHPSHSRVSPIAVSATPLSLTCAGAISPALSASSITPRFCSLDNSNTKFHTEEEEERTSPTFQHHRFRSRSCSRAPGVTSNTFLRSHLTGITNTARESAYSSYLQRYPPRFLNPINEKMYLNYIEKFMRPRVLVIGTLLILMSVTNNLPTYLAVPGNVKTFPGNGESFFVRTLVLDLVELVVLFVMTTSGYLPFLRKRMECTLITTSSLYVVVAYVAPLINLFEVATTTPTFIGQTAQMLLSFPPVLIRSLCLPVFVDFIFIIRTRNSRYVHMLVLFLVLLLCTAFTSAGIVVMGNASYYTYIWSVGGLSTLVIIFCYLGAHLSELQHRAMFYRFWITRKNLGEVEMRFSMSKRSGMTVLEQIIMLLKDVESALGMINEEFLPDEVYEPLVRIALLQQKCMKLVTSNRDIYTISWRELGIPNDIPHLFEISEELRHYQEGIQDEAEEEGSEKEIRNCVCDNASDFPDGSDYENVLSDRMVVKFSDYIVDSKSNANDNIRSIHTSSTSSLNHLSSADSPFHCSYSSLDSTLSAFDSPSRKSTSSPSSKSNQCKNRLQRTFVLSSLISSSTNTAKCKRLVSASIGTWEIKPTVDLGVELFSRKLSDASEDTSLEFGECIETCFPTSHSSLHLPSSPTSLSRALSNIGNVWEFDLVSFNKDTHGMALSRVGLQLLAPAISSGFFKCCPAVFYQFLYALQKQYKPNPYHNQTHGAMVAHLTFCLVRIMQLFQLESPQNVADEVAIVVAALGHDVGHPGRNNAFFVYSSEPLALLYNDTAVLENYHSFIIFQTLSSEKRNIFADLPVPQYRQLRKHIIELILATDMSSHFSEISSFRVRRQSPEFDYITNEDDRWLVAKFCIKAADVGHSSVDWDQHYFWSLEVTEEFYAQGDEELLRGMAISPLCDRSKKNELFKSQEGFITFVVMPLLRELEEVAPLNGLFQSTVIGRALKNAERWGKLKQQGGGVSFTGCKLKQPGSASTLTGVDTKNR